MISADISVVQTISIQLASTLGNVVANISVSAGSGSSSPSRLIGPTDYIKVGNIYVSDSGDYFQIVGNILISDSSIMFKVGTNYYSDDGQVYRGVA